MWGLSACRTAEPVSGRVIAGRVTSVFEAQDHPRQRIVLYKSREQVLGPRQRDERNAEYLEKGAKIVVRNLFRQADLLDEDQLRIERMSHAERLDRDVRKQIARPDFSPDSEFERRRQRLDGNTTNLKKVGGGQVGVTESLHLNYQKRMFDGTLDIRPKANLDSVGIYAAWRRSF